MIEEIEHVIDADDKTDDGCNPVRHNVYLWQIQRQDGQENRCCQAECRGRIIGEEM